MDDIHYVPTPYSYSQAVVAGSQVYLALHRGFGETFTEQFHDTMKYLKETLSGLGLSLDCVVKVNVWLKNVSDLPEMEKLVLDYFQPGHYPARMTATTQFIDKDCLLMIDGIAYKGQ